MAKLPLSHLPEDIKQAALSQSEAHARQKAEGKNEWVIDQKKPFWRKVLAFFCEPIFLLLIIAASLYFILGEVTDGIIMLGFVVFMSAINLIQEWRTDKTLDALKVLSSPHITVVREGHCLTIDSRDLVTNDVMVLNEGDRVPADGQILLTTDFGVDESALTGEADLVWKSIDKGEENHHWRRDCVYAGTAVVQGRAFVKVTAIGMKTEYGQIGADIAAAPDRPTPLEKQVGHLIKICGFISAGLCILVILATWWRVPSLIDALLSGVTIAMATIPEEFPVILTVFLAMGVWRLAKQKALVRRFPSVETLGAVSVLCVDKTGTLTENRMQLNEVYPACGQDRKTLLTSAVLASETDPFDPMEKAILQCASDEGIDLTALEKLTLLKEYPFRSETRMMGHVWQQDEGSLITIKGAPESVLPLCGLSVEEKSVIEKHQYEMASQGYRIIAVGIQEIKEKEALAEDINNTHLHLIGLLGFEDPHRAAVPQAVAACQKAGIRLIMITGDNPVTARSIGEKIGMNIDEIVDGTQMEKMSDERLAEQVGKTTIFSRVLPRQKRRIVTALKSRGEIVAMTGDGVNDAPALKYADIGIAMGNRGTDVAREAADLVLLDDNFETIVATIQDGRRIYDNIRKAIEYIFVIHLPIALSALLAPLLGVPLFLLPVHVVLLELIIDPTCSIIFERQPAEPDVMDRPPRSIKDPLVSTDLLKKALLQGLTIFMTVFGSYLFQLNNGVDIATARTFSLLVLVISNLLLVYINRSDSETILHIHFRQADWVPWVINAIILVGMFIIIYFPPANGFVQTAPLSSLQMMAALILSIFFTGWWEIVKWARQSNRHR